MKGWQLATVLIGIASSAEAFAPRKADPPFVVAGHPHAWATRRIVAHALTRSFDALAAAGWQAIWDRDTGVPVRIWGGHVDAAGAVKDPAIAERAARAFLASHLALLAPGAQLADFVIATNQRDGELRTVGFRQTASGLPVIGGQLGFVFAHDRLFAIGSEALPNVRVATAARAQPQMMRDRAEAWVTAETGTPVTTRAVGARAILPIIDGASIEYHVVDVLEVESRGAPGSWDVYVGSDGTPLARRNRLLFATGTLVYDAGVRYASGPRASSPAANVQLSVDGSAAIAGSDGSFSWPGPSAATVLPGLVSASTNIINRAGPLATAALTAQPGQPVAWSLAGDELGDAQLSTFIYAHAIIERDRLVNPSAASWLAQRLDFYVNENDVCNAYSTGDDVHFFRKNGQCENTGRIADVVYHEFGHSLHNHSIIAGMGAFDPSLSEGLADYNAANLTEDSGIGRGFDFTNGPLREIDPNGFERRYPEDLDVDAHVSGEIVSGALWDLRKALIAELGRDPGVTQSDRIFAGVLQRASSIPTSYLAALIADDDDGDLGNHTPHFCAIQRAFGVHGLVPGGFAMTTVGQHTVSGLTISVPVATPSGALDCPQPHVSSITISWKVGDGVASSFQLQVRGDTWTGSFPDQPAGTVVLYMITAALEDGSSQILPNNPADQLYQLFVGESTPLFCESFDTDPHWLQSSSLAGSAWQYGTPRAPQSGDPAAAYTGISVLGTDVTDDGRYRATEVTHIETPAIDVSRYETIRLQYRRWLTVEDAKFDQATIDVNGVTVWSNVMTSRGSLDHVDKEWRFHDVDLTPSVTNGAATIRWTLTSDSSKQLGGWTLDDVCVVGVTKKCGNGALDTNEECDDGNGKGGDGCSAACLEEPTAGGGGCCSASSHPTGPLLLGLGVLALVLRKRRSDGTAGSRVAANRRSDD